MIPLFLAGLQTAPPPMPVAPGPLESVVPMYPVIRDRHPRATVVGITVSAVTGVLVGSLVANRVVLRGPVHVVSMP